MSGQSTRNRATFLALAFALAPISAAFAQHHGGHHKGGHQGGAALTAKPAAKAAMPARPAPKTMQHAQAANNQANANRPRPSDASLVSSLHSARMQLSQAGHDYDGHRGRAMREIEAAMRLLGHRSGRANTGALGGRPVRELRHRREPGRAARPPANRTRGPRPAPGPRPRPAQPPAPIRTGTGSTAGQSTTQAASRLAASIGAADPMQSLESQMDTNGMNPHNFVQAKDAVQIGRPRAEHRPWSTVEAPRDDGAPAGLDAPR